MDWSGVLVGVAAGLVGEHLLLPQAQARVRRRREEAFYAKPNDAWARVEASRRGLTLVQAGWDDDGAFPEGSIVLRLGPPFRLRPKLKRALRDPHEKEWIEEEQDDRHQLGVAAMSIRRTSDSPVDELEARSHHMLLTAQRYRWFDYLATHRLRVRGSPAETELLDEVVGAPDPHTPVKGFPNPCSVGITLFGEGGAQLILPRRSDAPSSGGWWAAGLVYNAVGENAAPRDLYVGLDGHNETTPHVVARRGLHEEVGLSQEEVQASILQMHSLAWATDLLDHKFFGLAITPLSRAEIQERWRNAPDRPETKGKHLNALPSRTRDDCVAIVRTIRQSPDDWGPEAVFSTLRSLLCLRRIGPEDLVKVFT